MQLMATKFEPNWPSNSYVTVLLTVGVNYPGENVYIMNAMH